MLGARAPSLGLAPCLCSLACVLLHQLLLSPPSLLRVPYQLGLTFQVWNERGWSLPELCRHVPGLWASEAKIAVVVYDYPARRSVCVYGTVFAASFCCRLSASRHMSNALRYRAAHSVVHWVGAGCQRGVGVPAFRVGKQQDVLIGQLQSFAAGPWTPPTSEGDLPHGRVRPAGADFRAGGMHKCAAFWKAALAAACCPPFETALLVDVVDNGLDLLRFFKAPEERFQNGAGVVKEPNPRARARHERLIPSMHFPNRPLDPLPSHLGVAEVVLREKVAELVAMGAARPCPPGEKPWVVSPLTLAVNGAGTKVRLIHDLRGLNTFLDPFSFKFPTLREWVKGIDEGDLLVGVDWQAAYHAILLDENSQSLCGFELDGRYYVMVALPFGLNIAPALFQLSTEVFHAFLRRYGGIRSMGFIDDSAASAGAQFGQSAVERGRAVAWLLCEASYIAGHTVSVPKCQLTPLPTMRHLGLLVDALKRAFHIPRDKLDRFNDLLQRLLKNGCASIVELQRLAGWLVSFTAAVPCALVFLRELFAVVAEGLRRGARVVSVASAAARDALAALQDVELWSGAFPWPSDSHLHVHVVATDASSTGLAGALVVSTPTLDRWQPLLFRYRRGLTGEERERHIMVNEARAVLEAVEEFHSVLAGNHVRFLIDNEAAQAALAGVGSVNLELNAVVKATWRALIKWAIHPAFDRIATLDNTVADGDSRARMRSGETWRATCLAPRAHVLLSLEYPRFVPIWCRPRSEIQLHPRLAERVHRFAQGRISLDLFATKRSTLVPRFVSLLPEADGSQVAVDAFSFCPDGSEIVYCNPPWHLYAAVRNHLRAVRASGVWVYPDDARALWFPVVREASRGAEVLATAWEAATFVSCSNAGNQVLPAGQYDLIMAWFDFKSTS